MKIATTVLVFCVAALLALGTVMLWSAPAGTRFVNQQFVWVGLGVVACAVTALFDYRRLKQVSWILLLLAVVLLSLVFVPMIGIEKNGARRWLNLQVASFQPSEFAKLALIVALAHYCDFRQRHMGRFLKGTVTPGLIAAPVLVLLVKEPDFGTTVLLAAVTGVMLLVAGGRWFHLGPVALVSMTALVLVVMNNDNRKGRLQAFLNPEANIKGGYYQQYQAKLALGSGGTTGVGLGDGRQKYGWVPENHTDFILSVVGEELGLAATMGVVLAFLAIAVCGMIISTHASDRFGMMLGVGITFLLSLQAFINIGVVTGVLPNKGLPLPFVSYGGSSLVMMLTSLGLLLSVARYAHEPRRQTEAGFNPFNPGEIPSTQLP